MRKRPSIERSVQLNLFRTRPLTPRWWDLTMEARHRTLPLLARLLRVHRNALLAADRHAEVSDE